MKVSNPESTRVTRTSGIPRDGCREAPAESGERSLSESNTQRGHVVIIDDEVGIREALGRALEAEELRVICVGSLGEARERLGKLNDVRAILCDLNLGPESGSDFLPWLERERPDLIDNLLFMTGGATPGHLERFVAENRQRIFEKPVSVDDLIMRIAALPSR